MTTIYTTYQFSGIPINDQYNLRDFLVLNMSPQGIPVYDVLYDNSAQDITVTTTESQFSSTTQSILLNAITTLYPNAPAPQRFPTMGTDDIISQSVYGIFSQITNIDGDYVVTSNMTLTRNMYFGNLTVNTGITLFTNGWRITVSQILTLNGTISADGPDAVNNIAGTVTIPANTTYLGPGTSGGVGLTGNGTGKTGVLATNTCAGDSGGAGGNGTVSSPGGAGGTIVPIAAIDGGTFMLASMPTAYLGRIMSQNFYIMGGTGGGGGGANKGTATTIKSGGGGGGAGFIIIAAKSIVGSGTITARGGDGGNAAYTGTNVPTGLGGGGGGGGGCIIVITQGILPPITIDVSGGIGGTAIGTSGTAGTAGTNGNYFIVNL